MNSIKLSQDYYVLTDEHYQWHETYDLAVIQAASRYSFTCVGFYTDYLDINGIIRVQHSYDRLRLVNGDCPKLCIVIRSNLLGMLQEDPECGDYKDLDLFLRLTEIAPIARLPLVAFKEIKEKTYTGTPEIVFRKAEIRNR